MESNLLLDFDPEEVEDIKDPVVTVSSLTGVGENLGENVFENQSRAHPRQGSLLYICLNRQHK